MTVRTGRAARMRLTVSAAGAALIALGALLARPQVRADDPRPVFVGSTACQACHPKEHASWAKTAMAGAFAHLAPGSEEKAKVGLDPRVDYRADPTCVGCHTVGFGDPGGFRLDMNLDAAAKAGLLGVGCEACHGAAGFWLGEGLHDEALKDPAVLEERRPLLAELGFVRVPREGHCLACHNERSPTFEPFDYERRRTEGTHERAER